MLDRLYHLAAGQRQDLDAGSAAPSAPAPRRDDAAAGNAQYACGARCPGVGPHRSGVGPIGEAIKQAPRFLLAALIRAQSLIASDMQPVPGGLSAPLGGRTAADFIIAQQARTPCPSSSAKLVCGTIARSWTFVAQPGRGGNGRWRLQAGARPIQARRLNRGSKPRRKTSGAYAGRSRPGGPCRQRYSGLPKGDRGVQRGASGGSRAVIAARKARSPRLCGGDCPDACATAG